MRIAVLLCGLIASPAFADPYDVLGFSPDGVYVAVVEHGTRDGTGNYWARGLLLDVKKNAPVEAPALIEQDASSDGASEISAVTEAKKKLEALRTRLKIGRWVPGVAMKLQGADSVDKDGGPIVSIEVKLRKVKAKKPCDEPFLAQAMKVRLFFMGGDKPVTLHDDKEPPAERACTTECALQAGYGLDKSSLVVIECKVPGFEGPGTARAFLTGRTEYPLVDVPL